jgi:hypothetical protein
MSQKNRNRRPKPTRPILRLEQLEDRTLLSGNVTAVLTPTGVLNIMDDNANNNITISQPTAGDIRVAGTFIPGTKTTPPDMTTVNNFASVDFLIEDVPLSGITINMGRGGNDTVSVNGGTTGIRLANNLLFYGPGVNGQTGNDTFSATGISANAITVSTTNATTANITLNNLNAGAVYVTSGTGKTNVSMDNSNNGKGSSLKVGTIRVDESKSTANNSSINISNFSSIGQLNVVGGSGKDPISVTNSNITNFLFTSPPSGGGHVTFDGNTARTGNITVGSGTTLDASKDTITGPLGWTITVGAADTTAVDNVTVNNDNVTAGPLTVNVLDDGPVYWAPPDDKHPNGQVLPSSNLSVNNNTVAKAVTINAGNYFQTVTVGTTGTSLNSTIGTNSQTVQYNNKISGNENITVGDFFSPNPPIPALPASSFLLAGTAGSLHNLTIGNNAAGGVSQAAIVAGNLTVSVGDNAGAVTVVRPTGGSDSVTVGDNSGPVTVTGTDTAADKVALTEDIEVGTNPNPKVSIPVTVGGSLAASGSGSWTQTIAVGDNVSLNVSSSVVGSQTIEAGNSDSVTVTSASVGSSSITAGDNASISVSGVTATSGDVSVIAGLSSTLISLDKITANHGQVFVQADDGAAVIGVTNTTASYMQILNGNGSTYFDLEHDNLSTGTADFSSAAFGMDLETGTGNNIIYMNALNVLDGMFVTCNSQYGTSFDTVFVNSVVSDFGTIDGGSAGVNPNPPFDTANVYIDVNPGTSLGFNVINFSGYPTI